jgi:RES domain-containing protein
MKELWRIASDTPLYTSDDLSGKGAELTGGRWNRNGSAVVYTSIGIALACMETVVHLGATTLPMNRFLVRIDVPDDVWARRRTAAANTLPVGWTAAPSGRVSHDFGEAWLKDSSSPALLEVPSVIVPEEFNVLIDPRHPDAARILATRLRQFRYDARLAG